MEESRAPFETLKQILRHARQPDLLNDHPWTQSLIVREALDSCPQLAEVIPGQQLIGALARLFPQLQPAQPPRTGKRLDSRWGEFGLLAALYFAPFNHGTSFPTSLMEAWCRIDPAILYFVYGKPAAALCPEEIKKYELVGAELEYGSASTLSDWHRKGLQRFADIILNRERFLSRNTARASTLLVEAQASRNSASDLPQPSTSVRGARSRVARRFFWLGFVVLFLIAVGLGVFKGRKIYNAGTLVYEDFTRLQELVRQPAGAETLNQALPVLGTLRDHLYLFKEEAWPLLWLSPRLGWVPTYGSELASAPILLDVVEHSLNASILSAEAARPLVAELQSPRSTLTPARATNLLVEAQPRLGEARIELDRALASRAMVQPETFSPRLRDLIQEDLDPALKLADEGLSFASALPGLLGAGSDGPKTYLLLAQNEDELRPTGGFITSVGNLVLHNGEVISLAFESVDNDVQENWSRPYPAAPWQLQEYMDSPVLILRDANWFTDFPTTVLWVEYLYAYKHSHSVDGVIAFDQNFLVRLLGVIGPLQVEGVPYPISEENVIEYMRQAKVPPSQEVGSLGWDRKEFIRKLAASVLERLSHGSHDWLALARILSGALDERHLLLQFDDPVMSRLTAARGWDNAVRAEGGDYLMVTDTNIGSNKTNVLVDVRLTYDVDLSDPASPLGSLTVSHQNKANKDVPCLPMTAIAQFEEEKWYPINTCYWNYLRVYKQEGVKLLDSTTQAIPGGWLLSGDKLPPQVDELDEEIPGVLGFGTMQVVPGGESLRTRFEFNLPFGVVVESDPGIYSYHLKVQKQPGTRAVPLTIRVHLPAHAVLESVLGQALVQGQSLLLETDLRTDLEFELRFRTSLVE